MRTLDSLSPGRLVGLSLGGCLVGASTFLAIKLLGRPGHMAPALIAAVCLLGSGFWLMMRAEQALKRGVDDERWSEAVLLPVRRAIRSRWYTGAIFAMFAVSVGLMMASISHGHLSAWGWMGLIVLQCLCRLSYALRWPSANGTPPGFWQTFRPVKSDHWGER